jgi:CRISPR-associated endoribonuclease Cas6
MPHLTIPPHTELLGINITIQPKTDCYLRPQYPTALHGWFLDQVRRSNPSLSQQLHDGQAEKPFTISGFTGNMPTLDRQLLLRADRSYQWQITALARPLCDWCRQWLAAPPTTLRLNSTTYQITDWQYVLPPTTYTQIWDQAATADRPLELTFTSPTSFRKRKNHMPLPIPENIFHSYLRRWNYFSPHQFDQDKFLDWVNDSIVILRHDVRSSKVQAGKSGSVTGFVGKIQMGLTTAARKNPEFAQLAHALIHTAPYFNTGHKVTFGLGQTQLGWLDEVNVLPHATRSPRAQPNLIPMTSPLPPTALTTSNRSTITIREQELATIFLNLKKRQGGDRAKKTAQLWAQIIARLELNLSLKAIATELQLPYDTVKKYAQLAKKHLLV